MIKSFIITMISREDSTVHVIPRDKELLQDLNALLDWLREQADDETGIAPIRAAQAPGGQQQSRFDTLRCLELIKFDGQWIVLDFERPVSMEDLIRLRAARLKTGSQSAAAIIEVMHQRS